MAHRGPRRSSSWGRQHAPVQGRCSANPAIAPRRPAHLRPLVIFLLYTGARAGEALWLDWRYIDLARAHVVFPKTKNGEARGVPLHQRVVTTLANLTHREDEVFRRPDGLPYDRPNPEADDDTSAGTRIGTAFNGACR